MGRYARELEVAAAAGREAGVAIMRYYGEDCSVAGKGPESPLTRADMEANACIRKTIAEAFPGDGWLSEETADSAERLSRRRVWIVDPLDGTKEFISRVPEFCVCIALVEDGRPVVAVSYNPATERLYAAELGCGATVNGAICRVRETSRLAQAVVLASRSESARGEWASFQGKFEIHLTGSVAYKLAQLSAGRCDATFTLTPKNEWDICAGTLLVQEAGGRVSGLDGLPIAFNRPSTLRPEMIASNGVLHEELLRTIRAVGHS